ncbi:MAG: SH3 domain-containing protein [Devosia sp.]|nr:SH3 domain-containing protein [Devosia sp.]
MSLRNKALTLGIAIAALCVSTAGALAATAFATTPLNVRAGPGPDYRVVDVLRRGERVDVEYCRGTWCKVTRPGPDGWVSARYLSRGGRSYGDDFYDDDYYDDRFYIVPPRIVRRYPRIYRDYDPDFSACIGGPGASFCIYD